MLSFDGREDPFLLNQGMTATGLGKTLHQILIGGFKKEDFNLVALCLDTIQDLIAVTQKIRASGINDGGNFFIAMIRQREEIREHDKREVINDKKTGVFESPCSGTFTRAGQAGDHNQLTLHSRLSPIID
jgi:hypothetical protein